MEKVLGNGFCEITQEEMLIIDGGKIWGMSTGAFVSSILAGAGVGNAIGGPVGGIIGGVVSAAVAYAYDQI